MRKSACRLCLCLPAGALRRPRQNCRRVSVDSEPDARRSHHVSLLPGRRTSPASRSADSARSRWLLNRASSLQVSGLKVLSTCDYTRRNRFILASSLCFGLGNLLVPDFATHLVSLAHGLRFARDSTDALAREPPQFDSVETTSSGLQGLFDAIVIILSTPFLISAIVGTLLNLILPNEAEDTPASLGSTVVHPHPDDLIGPAADERELKDEIELDDKKFAHETGANTQTLSREVV
jgi:hypothetical protein